MKNSKLIRLLKSLTKQEFRQLGKFLQSSFFNKNEDVIHLYNYLKDNSYYPSFDAPELEKEQADKKIFGKQLADYTYQVRRIRDLMSTLSLLVIDFLAVLETRDKNSLTRDRLLLQSFSKRNLYPLFKAQTEETLAKLEANPIRDVQYYRTAFDLKEAYFFHPNTSKLTLHSERVNLLMRDLDLLYALTKLRISCELRSREKILSEQYEIDLIEEVIKISEEKYAIHSSLLLVYTQLIQLFAEGYEEASYQEVKKLYFANLVIIGAEEQKIILHYLINIISSAVNAGVPNAIREVFVFYQLGIQHKILVLNERISPESYSNIAVLGSKLQEFDWTLGFIREYEQFLDEEIREDTQLMAMAYWHFNQANYDQAISLINEHQLPGKVFNIRARSLLIRNYMEKYLVDASFYQILTANTEAFRKQVERSDLISKQKKVAYKNFISLILRLTNLIQNNKYTIPLKKLQRLKEELSKKETIIARDWLQNKLVALEKNAY